MLSSPRSNNLINQIHERSMRTVYNDTSSKFQLLQRNRSVNIHHRNIQTITMEVFKVGNNICPPIVKIFLILGKQIQRQKIQRNETAKIRTV